MNDVNIITIEGIYTVSEILSAFGITKTVEVTTKRNGINMASVDRSITSALATWLIKENIDCPDYSRPARAMTDFLSIVSTMTAKMLITVLSQKYSNWEVEQVNIHAKEGASSFTVLLKKTAAEGERIPQHDDKESEVDP